MTRTKLSLALVTLMALGSTSQAEAGGYGRKSYGYGYAPSGYSGYGYAGYRKRRVNTGAVVAGTIGALALGAIAGQGLGQVPAYGAQPGYDGYVPAYGYPQCTVVLRRVADAWGNVGTIREKVCQ